jgi:hypothetical protein
MKKVVFLMAMGFIAVSSWAEKGHGHHVPSGSDDSRAAGCAPSNERLFMEFNNVRTLIETAGSLWQNRATGSPSYEFPSGSGNHVLFSGALWMGGEDINGQLKLAAHMYRSGGNDFWAGPLGDLDTESGNYDPFVIQNSDNELFRNFGAAEIIPAECSKYDQFYTIRRAEVEQFILWWKCENGELEPEDCEDVEELDQEVLDRIINWPAHGDEGLGEDKYLAPFFDNVPEGQESGNGKYDPINDGDYPWYDIGKKIDCRRDRRVTLYGDETHWWVFNDKGSIHTETNADPIGMEVRAQAFSFATDDEINNMTFYNYELINRGTQELKNTYFGQFADPDLGFADDDRVGCDVGRGLGYCYNGSATDPGAPGQPGYGDNVPAVGIDFFEGPYQDKTYADDPIGIGINQALNGVGYGDGFVDNERFGMRRFIYFNRSTANNGDPTTASQYYNYMKGIWRNGQRMLYGGDGLNSTPTNLEADFMFPGDSDPQNWGTNGIDPGFDWSELQTGGGEIQSDDRRFVQAAGPFTLKPGAVNNITVGVVVARGTDSDLESPIRALKQADSKAQALFDGCFELVNPPSAPVLTIQEMENELILYLNDPPGNDLLSFEEEDKVNIITPQALLDSGIVYDNKFRFEGFQIFQMKNDIANVTQLDDPEQARLVAQCDIKNGVSRLVNYTFDEELGLSTPVLKVDGADAGIRRSFHVTEDLFATGENRTLVNHKKYYYIAVSYAHNNYKTYDPTDPDALDGQKEPYLRSRLSATGKGIESVIGIPHDPSPEAEGTIATTSYGFQPEITQIEGIGNGGNFLELTDKTVDQILKHGAVNHPVYKSGAGPVDVKIIDPLNLAAGDYTLRFGTDSSVFNNNLWELVRIYTDENGMEQSDTVKADETIGTLHEQLILDWGISVHINQQYYEGSGTSIYTKPIGATMEFADSSKIWLGGIEDSDSFYPTNWIRSGNNEEAKNHNDPNAPSNPECVASAWIYAPCAYDDRLIDREESLYEQLNGGTIAPFTLVGRGVYGMPYGYPGENPEDPFYETGNNQSWFSSGADVAQRQSTLEELHDVDIIITSDQSKWTRCPVIEINDNQSQTEHGDDILHLRSDESVGKDGNPDGTGTGMGWFPGYAIDVNTGARLNMMFSENSWLKGENGDDMVWNPTSNFSDPVGNPLFGGMHYVYVFGEDVDGSNSPAYDEGEWLREKFSNPGASSLVDFRDAWKSCFWVFEPLLLPNVEFMATDVKISARINKPYDERVVMNENQGSPMYRFSIDPPTLTQQGDHLISVLDNINIVPNPYYAYSEYETSRLDNRVKFTNLPEQCEVTIFNMNGGLVRSYRKDDLLTSLDWDLKNHKGIPIAGGVYLVHVKVNVDGTDYEKICKWYGSMRQVDLDNL